MITSLPRLRSPIVLIHGLFGYDEIRVGPWRLWEYFRGIRRFLESAGNRVFVPQLSRMGSVAQRARELAGFLEANLPGEPAHLFAHSMGGLDSRHLITHMKQSHRVLSLTTIGTPHRGSSYADWMLRRLEAVAKPFFQVLRIPFDAFLDLTTREGKLFDARTPNVESVRYFGVAGTCEGPWLSPPWYLPHSIVAKHEGPNDGVVSVESARFGESFDVWQGDHLNLINVPNHRAMLRGLWSDRTPQYGRLVQRLADCGF